MKEFIRKDKIGTLSQQKLWSFIWHFLKSYKNFVVMFWILSVITGLWSPFNNLLLKFLIDDLNTAQPNHIATFICQLAVLFVLNFELHNLCWRGMGYLNYKFQPVIKNQVISETFAYVHGHTHQFFHDKLSGRISSQISVLADNVEWIIHDFSRNLVRSVVLIVVAFVSMYCVHPQFFYALLIWLLLFVAFSTHMSKRIINLSKSHAEAETMLWGQIVDSITNSSSVRMFSRRMHETTYLEKTLYLTKKTFQAKENFEIKMHFFQGLSLSIMIGFMLYFLIRLRSYKLVSVGDFSLILGLSIDVGFMTWWALEQVDDLNKAIGKCKQSLSTLFIPHEIKDKENAKELMITNGKIMFTGVSFHYRDTEPFFQDQSITIVGGQKVGLVGYSGGGKSTFVYLLLRLYDVTDGQILIDGQDIRDVTQDSLHACIAMVPQDPSLFHRSIMDNIRYGRVSATDEEVIEAAKKAHAHEFIVKTMHGYDSLVGERGLKLSGGQRQRIAFARAILKNAPILILDEATSQLDSITERYMQESLWELMYGKTAIVIAHRLSTLLHMDRILVFDKGRIIEDGTHSELLAKHGLYKKLWEAQIVGFSPDSNLQ